jgi:hypothetical protein
MGGCSVVREEISTYTAPCAAVPAAQRLRTSHQSQAAGVLPGAMPFDGRVAHIALLDLNVYASDT